MNKTPYEIKLETMLLKAWSDTIFEKDRSKNLIKFIADLSSKIHSAYDFNSDPEQMTLKVHNIIQTTI